MQLANKIVGVFFPEMFEVVVVHVFDVGFGEGGIVEGGAHGFVPVKLPHL